MEVVAELLPISVICGAINVFHSCLCKGLGPTGWLFGGGNSGAFLSGPMNPRPARELTEGSVSSAYPSFTENRGGFCTGSHFGQLDHHKLELLFWSYSY